MDYNSVYKSTFEKRQHALKVLQINNDQQQQHHHPITKKIIKQSYHKLALLYHPDKNTSICASEKFKEVNEAYIFLSKRTFEKEEGEVVDSASSDEDEEEEEEYFQTDTYEFFDTHTPTSYNKYLWYFLHSLNLYNEKIIFEYAKELVHSCETNCVQILDKIQDKNILQCVYEFIDKYKLVFHISLETIDKLQGYIKTRFEKLDYSPENGSSSPPPPQFIQIRPKWKDLLEGNVFVYYADEKGGNEQRVFYIPMWCIHQDLIFDCCQQENENGGERGGEEQEEIIFQCLFETKTENIKIENGHVHIFETIPIHEIWNQEVWKVQLEEDISFSIYTEELYLRKYQKVCFPEKGMVFYNENDIYNVSIRGNVYIHITLTID